MAAIDSLLALAESQKATGLILRVGEPPTLTGAQGRGLTMPPLDLGVLATFADETLTQEALVRLRTSGACETMYHSDRHGTFVVEAKLDGDKLSLKLRPAGTVLPKPAQSARTPRMNEATLPDPLPAATLTASSVLTVHVPSRLAGQIARAIDETVSDILVSAGQPFWVRSSRGLETTGSTIEQTELAAFVDSLLDPTRRQHLDSSGSADFAWEAPSVDGRDPQRVRANVFRQANGLSLALRPVNRRAPTLAELNLPESLAPLGEMPGGLVLIVGTAGSGKSTTLAALVDLVNRTRARHVITLEDPIEFVYQPRRCLIHQREIGTHIPSFASGLRAALREAPDIILVGEMRDRETVSLVLTAAETGHLVFSTLHSGSAAMAIDRIVDLFPEHQQAQIRLQVAGSLRAVVNQRLLNGLRPGTRYPALEILMANHAVSSLIRDGKTHQLATQIQTGRDDGMIPLDGSLLDLLRAGRISQEVALAVAREPQELQRRMRDPIP